MTITGMTRFVQQNYKVQNSHLTPKLPNGSLPPKGHVNPYCPEGMDITGRTDFRRIVPVDEGVANKIKSLVFERMEKNGGMSGGEIESEIIKDYVMSLPPEERAAAGWTLNQISLQEADRLGEYVHQRDPSWNWGKPVKPDILDDYKSGMNILICSKKLPDCRSLPTALFCYLQLNIRRPAVAHEAVNLKPICCFFVVCLANFQMPSSKE